MVTLRRFKMEQKSLESISNASNIPVHRVGELWERFKNFHPEFVKYVFETDKHLNWSGFEDMYGNTAVAFLRCVAGRPVKNEGLIIRGRFRYTNHVPGWEPIPAKTLEGVIGKVGDPIEKEDFILFSQLIDSKVEEASKHHVPVNY